MYVDIVISNIFYLNKHFFFFSFSLMQLNDSELKQEKYAHGRQNEIHRAQLACATKPPMTPGNNAKTPGPQIISVSNQHTSCFC